MTVRNSRASVFLSLVVLLAVASLGCGLLGRAGQPPAGETTGAALEATELAFVPTRTPWPTFTPTPEDLPIVAPGGTGEQGSAVVLNTPTPTPLPTDTPTPLPPTDTPTPELPPTDTPPPPTNTPPPAPPPPTNPPAPPATATPAFPFTPLAWEGQWNAGLAQIRGKILDPGGSPVNGVWVQAKCGGTVLASNPSGINLYAPGDPYEAGAYDIVLSSPLSPDSMCNWEVRVVQANNYDEAKDLGAPSLSPTGYCDLAWEEVSICFANWRKN
jgi:hypothetical protein